MGVPWKKRVLAGALDVTGANWLLFRLRSLIFHPYIRAVNYHAVPQRWADSFERHLQYYARHFVAVTLSDLDRLHRGQWHHSKPGLILSFDDGLRDQVEVAAPLVEKYGFVGWFLVPTGFVDTPSQQQRDYARDHQIIPAADGAGAPDVAMTWDQVRQLDQRHVVGCHTQSHCRLRADLTDQQLQEEIPDAKHRLQEQLGHEVPVFCWVGGEEWSYSACAADAIRSAGFRYALMTNAYPIRPGSDLHQIQRTNIEADWPLRIVRFQLSGFMDVLYTPKRRRVNALTRPS